MDLILCHTTADFDTLGAAVGLTRLHPGARIVLAGGAHPTVQNFLALHRDEYALIERRSVNLSTVRSLFVVDTQRRSRLGKVAEWLDLPNVEIAIYDHHPTDHHGDADSDIAAHHRCIAAVGAVTTLIVEALQAKGITLTPTEATVMALGIHVDTGSLTYDQSTARDARALAWSMEQGASLRAIAEYTEPGLSPDLQSLLAIALDTLHSETIQGHTIAWVLLDLERFTPGLSSLAARLMETMELDALLLAAQYPRKGATDGKKDSLTVIGRSRIAGTDLNALFQPLGGGGHARAVSANLHHVQPQEVLAKLVQQLQAQLPHPPSARELMSSPVRTIRPDTTIGEAQRILLRYGHSGLSVVDEAGTLVGIISRRDLDIALHHGFSHAPVKGYMTTNLKAIAPDTLLPDIEALMVTYDIGRLPVLDQGELVGIVTRTDVLRQLHRQERGRGKREEGEEGEEKEEEEEREGREEGEEGEEGEEREEREEREEGKGKRKKGRGREEGRGETGSLLRLLSQSLVPEQWELLAISAQQAEERGWQLFLVGGAVRDLLLARMAPDGGPTKLLLEDLDLVVDGFHRSAESQAGVELARSLQAHYPQARLDIHGKFQTAALLWHNDPTFKSLWIDIATARTEFYPYPAANPEVEASSIQQDLYRRDFTINALAVRLTSPRLGELLDFFGGVLDLQSKQIRVLHPNSFIEDPTRIYRAVRFAVRLGFQIDSQTEGYIRHAIASGIYRQVRDRQDARFQPSTPALQTRLKAELNYILQAPYWNAALHYLADLGALQCIHPTLEANRNLWRQLRLGERLLKFPSLDSAHLNQSLPPWLMRLEIILAHLKPGDRAEVAQSFQLPADSIQRLSQLATAQTHIAEQLPDCQASSQIAQLLQPFDTALLILVAVRSSRTVRRAIWQYLITWSLVKPPLNGQDLKALGYRPGPQFKTILDALTAATLDGKICDRPSAITFLNQHHPL